jgi:pimeloyl-ACP methyl ester carboxylesterase
MTRVRPLRYLSVGSGLPVVIFQGYAMQPRTYLPLANLLADEARVVIPALFAAPGYWTYRHVLDCLRATLDELGLDRISLLGHSFGGGLELGLAAEEPQRVVECVFSDTLAVHKRFRLAAEALRNPFGMLSMATPPAISAFAQSWATHPGELVAGALWGFLSDRQMDIEAVVHAGIPSHVLWANHDTLLARSDGREFAERLNATFTVASGYGPSDQIDHDWMFDDPELFADHLRQLDLHFLQGGRQRPAKAGSGRRSAKRPDAGPTTSS